jgi:ubiquinone/menaquinone biosynthesis C-methylase UbiE
MVTFSVELLKFLLCPRDGGHLSLAEPTGALSVATGYIRCHRCAAAFEIADGILRLLPGQTQLDAMARQEQNARDLGAGQYDKHFTEAANHAELSVILEHSSKLQGKVMVDLACGTGRVTVHLIPYAQYIIAADLSEESLRILGQRLQGSPKIALIWSDATQVRFMPDQVDFTVTTQLFEHLSSRDQRHKLLNTIWTSLRAGGVLLMTAYYYSLLRRLMRKPNEGVHSNGIFFHRFTRQEIHHELSSLFEIADIRPIQIDPRLTRTPGFAVLAPLVDNVIFRDLLSQLVFVKGVKRHFPGGISDSRLIRLGPTT